MKILMLETMTYGDDISLEQFNRLGEVVTYSLSSYEEAVARMKEHNPDTSTVHRGCRTVSTEKQYRKDSVSSWELCGILMHSLYCMQISTILMLQSIHWNMINFRLWINGFFPR